MPIVTPASVSSHHERIDVPFIGRSLTEYERYFDLDFAAWRGRDVLDVAAGPSSFVAEACARRINAVGVDPRYGDTVDTLAAQIDADYGRFFAQMRAKSGQYRLSGSGFRTHAAAVADRRAAAERFLTDYATHLLHGRYVAGALPGLPFFDGTFDLVLSAHLLFIPAYPFDYDWHVAACRELVRVSAGEVLIHPVSRADGQFYPGFARLQRELRSFAIQCEISPTKARHRFSSTLRLRKAPP